MMQRAVLLSSSFFLRRSSSKSALPKSAVSNPRRCVFGATLRAQASHGRASPRWKGWTGDASALRVSRGPHKPPLAAGNLHRGLQSSCESAFSVEGDGGLSPAARDDEEEGGAGLLLDGGAPLDGGDEVPCAEDEEALPDASAQATRELKPGLYLVGTPIGNMEDITLRALRVLKTASCILAEDTRHSFKLLRHYGIDTPCMSYHKFNQYARQGELMERLRRGDVLALISDAGMPGISDPGSDLVRACVEAKVQVFPIPGPSAALAAIVASGLSTSEFSFVGFLSSKARIRRQRLDTAAKEAATQIFYVPPHKLRKYLDDFISAFGSSRWCAVAREMTKLHEEFWRGTLEEAKAKFEEQEPRGEITLIVGGAPEQTDEHSVTETELKSRLQVLLDAGKSTSEAIRLVVEETSARRNAVYSLALEIKRRPT